MPRLVIWDIDKVGHMAVRGVMPGLGGHMPYGLKVECKGLLNVMGWWLCGGTMPWLGGQKGSNVECKCKGVQSLFESPFLPVGAPVGGHPR